MLLGFSHRGPLGGQGLGQLVKLLPEIFLVAAAGAVQFSRLAPVAGRCQRLVAQRRRLLGQGHGPYRRGQQFRLLVGGQAADRAQRVAVGDPPQDAIQGVGVRGMSGHQQHAVAAQGRLGDDLHQDARLAGAGQALDQENVRRRQRAGHGVALGGV